jgi:hypothetical protein
LAMLSDRLFDRFPCVAARFRRQPRRSCFRAI